MGERERKKKGRERDRNVWCNFPQFILETHPTFTQNLAYVTGEQNFFLTTFSVAFLKLFILFSCPEHRPKPSPRAPRDVLQRFVYEDSYIACSANRNLVLAALVHEGRNSEVILAKRVPDDISQRWAIHSNG